MHEYRRRSVSAARDQLLIQRHNLTYTGECARTQYFALQVQKWWKFTVNFELIRNFCSLLRVLNMFLAFLPLFVSQTARKHGREEGELTTNKSPQQKSDPGRCNYVQYSVRLGPQGWGGPLHCVWIFLQDGTLPACLSCCVILLMTVKCLSRQKANNEKMTDVTTKKIMTTKTTTTSNTLFLAAVSFVTIIYRCYGYKRSCLGSWSCDLHCPWRLFQITWILKILLIKQNTFTIMQCSGLVMQIFI